MCGIAGVLDLQNHYIDGLSRNLSTMNEIQRHRGPDGSDVWMHENGHIGFAHVRLAIIDIEQGQQPMRDDIGNVICFNGEIYNYKELKNRLSGYNFKTNSDTEVILAAYQKWGQECVNYFKGMFAFAIWDESKKELFCVRDHFGIKPFYYIIVDGKLYFASEVKTLKPFFKERKLNLCAVKDYLSLQLYLGNKTMYEGVSNLLPAHMLTVKNGYVREKKYWELYYEEDFSHDEQYFKSRLDELLHESVRLHLESDVPVASYISGGVDSSLVTALATEYNKELVAYSGRFDYGELYDESYYAKKQAEKYSLELHIKTIEEEEFHNNINSVMYHMDYPAAGPGVFPQYMMSEFVSKKRKVVLGGQGGDEIFGGYIRYLIGYLEQSLRAGIDGNDKSVYLPIPLSDIMKQLPNLKNYKPLLQSFWRKNLFEDPAERYFNLINRAPDLEDDIDWEELPKDYNPLDEFKKIFNMDNVVSNSYFDRMLHFDFKVLLPHLLQVEDRMSMAHGLEARVPLLYQDLVEFVATVPNKIKFKQGRLKSFFVDVANPYLDASIVNRKNKMGFPFPINDWIANGEDVFLVQNDKNSPGNDNGLTFFQTEGNVRTFFLGRFSRSKWGIMNIIKSQNFLRV